LEAGELEDALGYKNLEVDNGNASYLNNLKSITGINLWKIWVLLALLFLVLEMVIVLFWDKANQWTKPNNQ
jgi:preprotein translocase subunit SecG